MAARYTQYLKLKLTDNLTADALSNLNIIDQLGASFRVNLGGELVLNSSTDIYVQPNSSDVGGSGVDGNIFLGTDSHQIASVVINSAVTQLKGSIRLSNGNFYTELNPHPSLASNLSFKFPLTDGTAGKYLQTDGSGQLSFSSALPITVSGANAFTADQSMGGFKLTNLATPTLNSDAARKDYVDSLVGATEFADTVFAIKDDLDPTKKIKFEATGVMTGTSRTITMPDSDVDLGALVNTNISASAAISYSKLNLASSILNADVASGAAISYDKLNLSSSILNADVAAGAAIVESKLSLDYSTSSLNTAVGGKLSLSGGTMSGAISMATFGITNLATPTISHHAATKDYVDLAISGSAYNRFTDTWTTGTSKTVTHNLGSRDVVVQLYDTVTFETVIVDSEVRTNTNVVDLTASVAPVNPLKVLIIKL